MVELYGRSLSRLALERRFGSLSQFAGAIAEAERRIRAVGTQPEEDYPEPSKVHPLLREPNKSG